MSESSSPFSAKTALALVVVGAVLFVALLAMLAGGLPGNTNDGGAHAGGKGLNGYAGLVALLDAAGYETKLARSTAALKQPGLLVLSPSQNTKGAEIEAIVAAHRAYGPVMVITPKWLAAGLPGITPGAKKGWVQLVGGAAPNWQGFLDDVSVHIDKLAEAQWLAGDIAGKLPVPSKFQTGHGARVVPLVTTRADGWMLAGYMADGYYPRMAGLAMGRASNGDNTAQDNAPRFPLIVVFEPDLLDNYGMRDAANAQLAERLIAASLPDSEKRITFDISLNGFARKANLLTLAFTPPYLAATLCLLLAALVVGWRGFCRFGPAIPPPRAIAFGKLAMVSNSAGLIARTGRLHLLAAPFAALKRERLIAMLGLSRQSDPALAEAALDKAMLARGHAPFSADAEALRKSRKAADLLRAAQKLDALERTISG